MTGRTITVPATSTRDYLPGEVFVSIRRDMAKPRTHLFVAAPSVMILTAEQARGLADALHDFADELDNGQ